MVTSCLGRSTETPPMAAISESFLHAIVQVSSFVMAFSLGLFASPLTSLSPRLHVRPMGLDEFLALLHEGSRRAGCRRSRTPLYKVQSRGILGVHVDKRPDNFACSLVVYIPVGTQLIGIGVCPECDAVYLCHGECLAMMFL